MSLIMHHRCILPDPADAKQHVFIATPIHGSPVPAYALALFETAQVLAKHNIAADFCIFAGDPHVDDSRNVLVREFLSTDCTDFVFIDADMRWYGEGLARLLEYDRDIVGGTYRLKGDKTMFPVVQMPGKQQAEADGLLEVKALPTGFLRIRRHVLEALNEKAVKFRGKGHKIGQLPIPIIFERTLTAQQRIGGDYTFCFKAIEAGFKIHLDPEQGFGHYGMKGYGGSWAAHVRSEMGLAMPQLLTAIRNGNERSGHYIELFEAWGNDWAAPPEMLEGLVELVRDTEGPILEYGSGLSTLIMAAAAGKGREVVAWENDPVWVKHTQNAAARYGLNNIRVVETALKGERGNKWYAHNMMYKNPFGLIVVDGPPRQYSAGRAGAIETVPPLLALGGVVVLDDADDFAIRDTAKELAAVIGGELHALGGLLEFHGENRRFFVIRQPAEERGSAA